MNGAKGGAERACVDGDYVRFGRSLCRALYDGGIGEGAVGDAVDARTGAVAPVFWITLAALLFCYDKTL